MSKNIAVVGSGSWGMALANHLAEMGNNVKVWSFTEEEKNLINNERKCMFIPDMVLDEKIYCSNDVVEVVKINILRISEGSQHTAEVSGNVLKHKKSCHIFFA